jgi:hypothetical protein
MEVAGYRKGEVIRKKKGTQKSEGRGQYLALCGAQCFHNCKSVRLLMNLVLWLKA